MTTTSEPTTAARAQPQETGGARRGTEQTLSELKERLLRSAQKGARDVEQERLMRLAAGEAEALAWLTPYPLLVLPILLEEKVNAAKRYVALQACLQEARRYEPPEPCCLRSRTGYVRN